MLSSSVWAFSQSDYVFSDLDLFILFWVLISNLRLKTEMALSWTYRERTRLLLPKAYKYTFQFITFILNETWKVRGWWWWCPPWFFIRDTGLAKGTSIWVELAQQSPAPLSWSRPVEAYSCPTDCCHVKQRRPRLILFCLVMSLSGLRKVWPKFPT